MPIDNWTDRPTHTQTDKADFIPSAADIGGNTFMNLWEISLIKSTGGIVISEVLSSI